MASIFGVEIKSLKEFKNHEGCPIFQGNVYYRGKKMGFWSQDAWGGPDNYEFDEHLLDEAVESFKNSDMVEEEYKEITDLAILLDELIRLKDSEKMYKKFVKQGYNIMCEVNDRYHYHYAAINSSERDISALMTVFADFIKDASSECYGNKKALVEIYTSLTDFVK